MQTAQRWFGGVMFNENEIKEVMKTYRASGAIGRNAIVPKIVRQECKPDDGFNILDFGCGEKLIHAKSLRDDGYTVYIYDFSIPGTECFLEKEYDVVFASNVLNVQLSSDMLNRTLKQIRSCIKSGGIFIANYPKEPRKAGLSVDQIKYQLEKVFSNVERIKANNNVAWKCTA